MAVSEYIRMRIPMLRIVPNSHKTSKFRIEGYREDGKRKRLFFATREEAQQKFKELKADLDFRKRQESIQQRREGEEAAHLPNEVRLMAVRGVKILTPYGKTLEDAIRHYVAYLEQSGKTITITDLVAEFLKVKEAEGARPRYLESLRFRLNRFKQDFGTRLASDITGKELQAWLLNLGQSPVSTNTYREKIGTLFSHALLHDYVAINPALKVRKLKVPSKKVQVYTPDELKLILKHTSPELIPIITIQAFAGLRPSEVESLEWKNVDLHGHGMIEVNAQKVNQRRYVPIEENLKQWLAPYAEKTGRLLNDVLNLPYHQFETIMEKAGVTLYPDGFRHSYATYHLAKHRNRAVLAEYMGNSPDIIKRHYDARALPVEGEKYWAISPF